MFGVLTKHFKDKVVDRAVHDLATRGQTGLDGIGKLKYDYIKNEITMTVSDEMLERVRSTWEASHFGKEYEI